MSTEFHLKTKPEKYLISHFSMKKKIDLSVFGNEVFVFLHKGHPIASAGLWVDTP
jgi:hypothetical protein